MTTPSTYVPDFEKLLPFEEAAKLAMKVYNFATLDDARFYVAIAKGIIKSDVIPEELPS